MTKVGRKIGSCITRALRQKSCEHLSKQIHQRDVLMQWRIETSEFVCYEKYKTWNKTRNFDCNTEFTLEQLLAFFSGPESFADLAVQVGAPKENYKETPKMKNISTVQSNPTKETPHQCK